MTLKIGKKYRHHRQKDTSPPYTCEAVLSNGDVAVTYTKNDKVYSTILVKQFLDDYKEVPEEDWRVVTRNNEGELLVGSFPYKSEQSVLNSWSWVPSFVKVVKVSL